MQGFKDIQRVMRFLRDYNNMHESLEWDLVDRVVTGSVAKPAHYYEGLWTRFFSVKALVNTNNGSLLLIAELFLCLFRLYKLLIWVLLYLMLFMCLSNIVHVKGLN